MKPAIYARQLGDPQKPPLIAIHGLFGSLENLGAVNRDLAEDYYIYALDLPSHGRSAHISPMNLPILAEAVLEWMASVGLSTAHFLGHSLGGKVAMEMALRYPEKVEQLVVADIAPVQYQPRHDDVFAGLSAVDLSAIHSRREADTYLQAHVSEASTRSFLLKNLYRDGQSWAWRLHLKGLMESYPQLIMANTGEHGAFKGKVLFIKAEHSTYILPEHRQAIVTRFPNADVKVMSDTHHWLHVEKPDLFSRIVKRFLRD